MTVKKWSLLLAAGAALSLATIYHIAWRSLAHACDGHLDNSLPVYTYQQAASTHGGYRSSTVSSGFETYVHDYDEYDLHLMATEPTRAIGRAGDGCILVFSIDGMNPASHVAVVQRDSGSDSYQVFRNRNVPALDWRSASFRQMELTPQRGARKQTSDVGLIEDVVRAMRDGTPAPHPSQMVNGHIAVPSGFRGWALAMFSDPLPGIKVGLGVYMDGAGVTYLTEKFEVEMVNREPVIDVRWVQASPLFSDWVRTP